MSISEIIAILLYVLPWVLTGVAVVVGVVKYLKVKGPNTTTLLTIAYTLSQNTSIKDIVAESIDIISTDIVDPEDYEEVKNGVSMVKQYMNTYLYSAVLAVKNTILERTEIDYEIYSVLADNKITIEQLSDISESILDIMGYSDNEIESLIKDAIKSKKEK